MRVNHQKTHWKGSVTQHQELRALPGAPREEGVGDLLGRAAETTQIVQNNIKYLNLQLLSYLCKQNVAVYNSYVVLSFIKHISPRYKKLPIPFDARSRSCLLQIQEGSFPANLSKR